MTKAADQVTKMKLRDDRTGRTDKRSRNQLSTEQLGVLELEFQKNPNWSVNHQKKIGKRLGLTVSKVYKWMWDKQRKEKSVSLN
mmetsp:Transcript_13617/g.21311  ORF Transcript_13617/g.21311 Transcript_13617/m.21311 type:complete len:84 (+) Transcript_13617:1479-1730(+)